MGSVEAIVVCGQTPDDWHRQGNYYTDIVDVSGQLPQYCTRAQNYHHPLRRASHYYQIDMLFHHGRLGAIDEIETKINIQSTPMFHDKPKLSILCLGAHSDDIEIGCGGTIRSILKHHANCEVTWVVFSATVQRKREALLGAARFLKGAKSSVVSVKNFKGGFFPSRATAIKKYFEGVKAWYSPDVIFTHYRHDLHQDHRIISELTWNTFRSHLILEYEIPKYDGDLGTPNTFVPLSDEEGATKATMIWECFATQRNKHWFTRDTFLSLMRIRGIECNVSTKYAEGFYCRKMVLQLGQ